MTVLSYGVTREVLMGFCGQPAATASQWLSVIVLKAQKNTPRWWGDLWPAFSLTNTWLCLQQYLVSGIFSIFSYLGLRSFRLMALQLNETSPLAWTLSWCICSQLMLFLQVKLHIICKPFVLCGSVLSGSLENLLSTVQHSKCLEKFYLGFAADTVR